MSLADLSIRRPIFITCVVVTMIAVGLLCMSKLGIELNPNVNIPVITVSVVYPGVGPSEMETLIAKPLEDEIGTISGLKRLTSKSFEGIAYVIAEFTLKTDIKYAEQQVRDKVNVAKAAFAPEVQEPVVRRIDLADQPVMLLAFKADLSDTRLYEIADDLIRRRLEQVDHVGRIEITGGRKREVQVLLDRDRLKARDLSVVGVSNQLGLEGENVPSGKVSRTNDEVIFRTIGEFHSVPEIRDSIIKLYGNEVPVKISDIGEVRDWMADEQSRAYLNGTKAVFINVYKQSDANTVAVAAALQKEITKLNSELKIQPGHPELMTTLDLSEWIRSSVEDVKETIFLGILLTILTVYLFLANGRSTIITGLALPNSLIGSFILMTVAGFTINTITLIALSLSVGLLIDDAIVVRENIFRHVEAGEDPLTASRVGTQEVRLAVIATTLVVLAVFGPVAFMQGMIGQFFREFGLTICFAMLISLFDALTVAPMLSAYFAGHRRRSGRDGGQASGVKGLWSRTVGRVLAGFGRFQDWLEIRYERAIRFSVSKPLRVIGASLLILVLSFATVPFLKKTFVPEEDHGHFGISMDMHPGTSLDAMERAVRKVDELVRANPNVDISALTVGGAQAYRATITISMVKARKRTMTTMQLKDHFREQLKRFPELNPKVVDWASTDGESQQPFNLDVMGYDQAELEKISTQIAGILKRQSGLTDLDMSFRPGKPEFQIKLDPASAVSYGISTKSYGYELRAQVEGLTPAKFRENGKEYDIRVRLRDDQRDLSRAFDRAYIPNVNGSLIRLSKVARAHTAAGPAQINRRDRARYVHITAGLAAGAGLGNVMEDVRKAIAKEVSFSPGMRYEFAGDSEFFEELMSNMILALAFSILFIFMVLSSLYESFVTPLTIMLALPLAMAGAFVALLVTHQSMSVYSMIGVILLLGVACKNSILLVDCARQFMDEGLDRAEAMVRAGKRRLRPILMTSMALIAGTIPVALGLNEASKVRVGMGVAIIGGLISSTVLTLLVVPATFSYVDRFRVWSATKIRGWVGMKKTAAEMLFFGVLTGTVLIVSSGNAQAGDPLRLDGYLEQTRTGNDSYRSASLRKNAGEMLAREGELQWAWQGALNLSTTRDRKPQLIPAVSGTGFDTSSASIGIQKQTSFGLLGKLHYDFSNNTIQGFPPGTLPFSTYYAGATVLELRQSLWRNWLGGELRATAEVTEATQLAQRHFRSFEEKSLLVRAETAYWRLYYAREAVRLQRDAVDRTRKIHDWNQSRVNRDLADRADLLQAEAGLESKELELKLATDEERAAARGFNSVRGIDSEEVGETLSDRPEGKLADEVPVPGPSRVQPERRDDVRAAEQTRRMTEASSAIGIERTRPVLELFATGSLNSLTPGARDAFGNSFGTENPVLTAGITLTAPLDFGLTGRVQDGYALQRQGAELTYDRLRFEAESQWSELVMNLRRARERLAITRKIEEAQRTKLDYERKQLFLGKTVTFRILQYELEFVQAQVTRIREEQGLLALLASVRLYKD